MSINGVISSIHLFSYPDLNPLLYDSSPHFGRPKPPPVFELNWLSKEKQQKLKIQFENFDTNNNGYLNLDEFDRIL